MTDSGQDGYRLAVTGHRPNRLGWLAARRLPRRIAAVLDEVAPKSGGSPPTLITALAEGADRIAAEAAWAARWRIHAVLPLPAADYAEDFADDKSREAFFSLLDRAAELDVAIPEAPGPSRPDCYRQAGLFMLDRADRLLAIYDGRGSGGSGGTQDIIAEARSRGIPVTELRV